MFKPKINKHILQIILGKNKSTVDPSSLPSNWQATMKIVEQQWTKNQIGNMGTRLEREFKRVKNINNIRGPK